MSSVTVTYSHDFGNSALTQHYQRKTEDEDITVLDVTQTFLESLEDAGFQNDVTVYVERKGELPACYRLHNGHIERES